MKARERILTALNHQEPDCVPIDVGGLDVDTLMAGPYRRLCEYLEIDPHPIGTPAEVADEVKRNIDILAPGGGFIFASVHNITEGVPTENIISAYQTAVEYGKY